MLSFMFGALDARQADEGRSYLSKKGGGNRVGEKLYDEQVNVWADPWNPEVPVLPWDGSSMLARERADIIKNGVVAGLDYTRFWAQKQGKRAIGRHGNIIMSGGSKSTEELIANTKKGVLVTRTWYIRMVDPQSQLLTGLTRDGTFYIENGKIKHPIKNFRFNESPVVMLNNIEELGKPVVVGGTGSGFQMLLPAMKVRDFNFTSLSDAV
jgi:predicted Zn-dependent protease